MDIGSTKVDICLKLQALPPRFDPVGGHPMCGKELSGLANADAIIFQNAIFVFTPLERTSPDARTLADELAQSVRARPLWLEASLHDRWVASTSHLPYLVSIALALATPGEVAPLIGPGFRSTSRLAGSSAQMVGDIIETNRNNILAALGRFRQELDQLEGYLAHADSDSLKELLRKGMSQYRELVS
jgi:prephenate dehydrogenase